MKWRKMNRAKRKGILPKLENCGKNMATKVKYVTVFFNQQLILCLMFSKQLCATLHFISSTSVALLTLLNMTS